MRLSFETQKAIYNDYLAEPNKSLIAAKHGTSARTVGRIIQKGLSGSYSDLEVEPSWKNGFKRGDIITSKGEAPYMYTTGDFTGVVTGFTEETALMRVEIITLPTGHSTSIEVGMSFNVVPCNFKLLSRPTESSETFEPVLDEEPEAKPEEPVELLKGTDGKLYRKVIKSNPLDYKVGDLVMLIDNQYASDLTVGDVGTIQSIYLDLLDLEAGSEPDGEPEVSFDLNMKTYDIELVGGEGATSIEGVLVELVSDEADTPEEPEEVQPEAKFINSPNALVLMVEGKEPLLVDSSHVGFEEACKACIDGDFLLAEKLMDVQTAIETFSEGLMEVDAVAGTLKYRGMEITNNLTDCIFAKMGLGDDSFKKLIKFFEKAMANPTPDARRQVMDFAAQGDINIDEDGNVLAFKNVNDNYRPSRVGCYDAEGIYQAHEYYNNEVGEICKMPRELVQEDISQTCAHGLHVCSVYYLKSMWGTKGQTMKVSINPKDFVAIPTDYKNSKARVCEYKVVENVTDDLDKYLDMV